MESNSINKEPSTKVISRIQKLLARRRSSFIAEADTALLKAQALMVEHGLTMADIEGQEINQPVLQEKIYNSVAPIWHGKLADILATNFRCKGFWQYLRDNGKLKKIMMFLGYEEDVKICVEAYRYAIFYINHNIRIQKKKNPRLTTGYINTYIDGFIFGLYTKFEEQVKKEEWGLILVTPPAVQSEFNALNVKMHSQKDTRFSNKNPSAFHKGYCDGKHFDHNQKRLSYKENPEQKSKT